MKLKFSDYLTIGYGRYADRAQEIADNISVNKKNEAIFMRKVIKYIKKSDTFWELRKTVMRAYDVFAGTKKGSDYYIYQKEFQTALSKRMIFYYKKFKILKKKIEAKQIELNNERSVPQTVEQADESHRKFERYVRAQINSTGFWSDERKDLISPPYLNEFASLVKGDGKKEAEYLCSKLEVFIRKIIIKTKDPDLFKPGYEKEQKEKADFEKFVRDLYT